MFSSFLNSCSYPDIQWIMLYAFIRFSFRFLKYHKSKGFNKTYGMTPCYSSPGTLICIILLKITFLMCAMYISISLMK